ELRLQLFPIRNVLLNRQEMSDSPFAVENGRNGRRLPEKFSILFPIMEFAPPFFSSSYGLPELLVTATRHLPGFEDARRLSDQLLHRVASDFARLRVDVLNSTFA